MKLMPIMMAALIAGSAPAFADTPGADWMAKADITKMLQDKGYTDIRKLEADDGHWEGNATKDGRKVEVHVDPHSGAITKSEPDH